MRLGFLYPKQRGSRSSQQQPPVPPPMNDVLQMIANKMNNTKMKANPPPKPPVFPVPQQAAV